MCPFNTHTIHRFRVVSYHYTVHTQCTTRMHTGRHKIVLEVLYCFYTKHSQHPNAHTLPPLPAHSSLACKDHTKALLVQVGPGSFTSDRRAPRPPALSQSSCKTQYTVSAHTHTHTEHTAQLTTLYIHRQYGHRLIKTPLIKSEQQRAV